MLAAAAFRGVLPILGLPFLFFIPALMGVGFALGRGPGAFATTLSVLLAAFLFIDPVFSFALTGRDWLTTVLFGGVSLGIVAVCDALAASLLRRDADLAALVASQAALAENEAFLRGVLGSSADCIKVLDLDARLTFMSEGGQGLPLQTTLAAVGGSKGQPTASRYPRRGGSEETSSRRRIVPPPQVPSTWAVSGRRSRHSRPAGTKSRATSQPNS